MPAIEIRAPDSTEPLDRALADLDSYDWMVLTSVNGVHAVEARMAELGIPLRKLMERKIAAIGPATAAALEAIARKPDLIPVEFVSEAIAGAFDELGQEGSKRILLARADIARKNLADLLRKQGHIVEEVAAYRIVRSKDTGELPDRAPEYITLTSSSSARHTSEILKESGREMGFEVAAEAREYTVPGLIQALVDHVREESIHA